MKYQSNCEWPAHHPGGKNIITTDTHPTSYVAKNVLKRLTTKGLRNEGKVFPIRVWISPIEGNDDE